MSSSAVNAITIPTGSSHFHRGGDEGGAGAGGTGFLGGPGRAEGTDFLGEPDRTEVMRCQGLTKGIPLLASSGW